MSLGNGDPLAFCGNPAHPQRQLMDLVVRNVNGIRLLSLLEDNLTLGVGVHENLVYSNAQGEIVLEQGEEANSIHIPYDKIHQLTLWMRRIAAECEGVPIPE